MLEVVFGNSAKAAIMMAKSFKAGKKLIGHPSISFIGELSGKEKRKIIKNLKRELSEGEELDGNSWEVINLGFHLDIGDISGEIDDEKRMLEFRRLYSSVDFEDEEVKAFFSSQREDFNTLIEYANRGEDIRVWITDSAATLCGLAYLCNILKNINCHISVISRPDKDTMFEENIKFFDDWGACPQNQFYLFTEYEHKLSDEEKQAQSEIWEKLTLENSPLRANNNGKLISVSEDYYDHLIMNCIPEGEFVMARLIGEVLGKYPIGIHDGWYSLRINRMIRDSIFEVISNGDITHPYGKILTYRSK